MRKKISFNWTSIFSILSIIVFNGVIATSFHLLSDQTYMKGSFWLVWIIKSLAVLASVSIPILIGMNYKKDSPIPHRSVLFLLVVELLIQLTTPIFSNQIIPNSELYLLRSSSGIFLSYLGILILGPVIVKELEKHSLLNIRRILVIIFIIFVTFNMLLHQDILGFRAGQNLIWYLFLFSIGYWIKRETWGRISSLKLSLLWVLFLFGSIISNWISTNRVQYDPHHGMTLTTHYLTSISSSQPMFLICAVIGLILVDKFLKKSIHLSVSALFSFGLVLILADNPKLLIFSLSFLKSGIKDLPVSLKLLVIFIFAAIFIAVIQFIYSKLRSINQSALPLKNFKFDLSHVDIFLKKILKAWRFWLLLGLSWLITVISMAQLWDWNLNMVQWLMIHREFIIFINVLIVLAIFSIVFAILNRFWYAFSFTMCAYIIWLVSSFIKINYRAEPILPSDMSMVGSMSELLEMVPKSTIITVLVLVIVLIVITVMIQHLDKKKTHVNWKYRLLMIIAPVLVLGSFFTANHPNTPISLLLEDIQDKPYFYAQLRGAKLNGTLLQFANNLDVKVMEKPADYSKAKIDQLEKKYTKVAQNINANRQEDDMSKQTVIFNLSESFSDPQRVPNLKVNKDPIPYIHQMKQSTASGLMLSCGYGGGTANIEYQTLTGLAINNFSPTLPTPYSQLVPYQQTAPAFTDLFDYKVGIHPFSANLYSRKQVYKKFGFDKFYHLKDGDKLTYTKHIDKSPYISDESAYKQTLKALDDHKGGQFINLVTMQNHMPFDDYYSKDQYSVSGTAYTSDVKKQQIENFTQGIHYTDDSLKQFIAEIDKLHRPITFIWYGDHLPGIYNGDSMQKYGLQLHETDYFIYSNKYSRQHNSNLEKTKIVSPNNFSAMALDKMNMKVSPYYALQTKVYLDLPAMTLDSFNSAKNNTINSSSEYVSEDGKVVEHLNKHQKEIMHDYELLQYDITSGKQYSLKNHFMDLKK